MTKSVPYNFKPRPYQLALLQALDGIAGDPDTQKRRALLRWHRRSGKDKVCWCFLIKEAFRVPGNYFYIFPRQKEAKQALWENVDKTGFRLLDHIPEHDKNIKRISNQEMAITLKNNSTIRVIGLDHDPDAIRGVACKGAVFSEYAFQDPNAAKILAPSLKEADGWAIFNSTPNGRNHMYDLEQAVTDSDRWYVSVLQVLWPDEPNYSGLIDHKELLQIIAEEGLSTEDAEREYGVSYSTGLKGAYYIQNIEMARAQGRVGNYPPQDHRWVDTFWDLGVSDDTAIWFRQVIEGRQVWVDYYEANNKGIADIVFDLQAKGYKFRTHYLPHDGGRSKQNRTIETTQDILRQCLREANISSDVVVCPRLPVQDGINGVRKLFSQFCFNEGLCRDGIRKLELYHRRFDPKRQAFMPEPVHDWCSHAADAIRTVIAADALEERSRQPIKVLTDYSIF